MAQFPLPTEIRTLVDNADRATTALETVLNLAEVEVREWQARQSLGPMAACTPPKLRVDDLMTALSAALTPEPSPV